MLGVAGLPVFADSPILPQGFGRLLGPTGGFLMAYPLAASVTGWLAERGFDRRYLHVDSRDARGPVDDFPGGVVWLAQRRRPRRPALATGLYPFVIVDLIKIVARGSRAAERVEAARGQGASSAADPFALLPENRST